MAELMAAAGDQVVQVVVPQVIVVMASLALFVLFGVNADLVELHLSHQLT